ncbi:MAG: flagellar M-ring protein FliF [Candidatus Magnetoglobus multicellularis str. Araruama]|uniref:Flagellar M-ring protein n=1 Tax=Candidatus Magnetoglobus multicellularis str. Araruama TaxID=890399 RepID=A0A1V1P4H5_9BACT|nr:MAG: flagellar M-ring protein FliF [Candidatus Magnetoglobus multicellularis str. Araruama]
MKKIFLQALEQLRNLWLTLEPSQKITITLLTVIIILALFFIGLWGARPDYETLFSQLDSADASEIINRLSEAKVPYKISAGGSTILVPKKQVYEMRIQMASQGLPKGSGVGFEVFDTFKLGATDFSQKINFQRALQTELERTISKISQVRQARVHIAIPDEQLFTDDKQDTTASVVLDLVGGVGLNPKQIKGIVHLIASSIKALAPQNVTIIDTDGNLLYNEEESSFSDGHFSVSQIEAKSVFERALENRVQTMLIKVIGPNKSVVRVSAELNFDQESMDSEIYEPTEEKIPRSTKVVEETHTTEGGAAANTPAITGTAIDLQQLEQAGNTSKYSRVEDIQNYEITKHIKREVKAPGTLQRLSVAVILDRAINDEQTEALTQIVSAAVGIREERGDALVIRNLAFDRSLLDKNIQQMQKTAQIDRWRDLAKTAGIAVVALIFLIFLYSAIRKIPGSLNIDKKAKNNDASEYQEEEIDYDEIDLSDVSKGPTTEAQRKIAMQRRIERLLKNDSDEFIRLLRSWLVED